MNAMKIFITIATLLACLTIATAYVADAPSLVACPTLARVLALVDTPVSLDPWLLRGMTHPHQLSCSAYLECGAEHDGHMRPKLEHCPNGELFDTKTAGCKKADEAECGPTLDTIELGPAPDAKCPPDNSNFTEFLPHESECKKFYVCDHGKAVLFECPEGLHFNPELQVCDWPDNAKCESGCVVNPKPVCPSKDLQPHEVNCGKFYQCNHETPVLMHCPNGLNFSPSLQVCDWPWREVCRLCGGNKV